jgi:hypothetical protein
MFKPDFVSTSQLLMQNDDYMAFAVSDWSQVSLETKQSAGHTETTRHFYAVVKYKLPEECMEQLKLLVYLNPNQDSWAKLVSRKPFERACATAKGLREKYLKDLLHTVGLQPKKSNPHVVDTMCDVFDTQIVNVENADGAEMRGIVFHAGCTPTHRAHQGVLTEIAEERDAGLLWLHGPPSERIGGEPWKQSASVNSLPVFTKGRVTKKTMDTYAAAGWSKGNGFAKIEPLVFI